jgi:hypothetical protein
MRSSSGPAPPRAEARAWRSYAATWLRARRRANPGRPSMSAAHMVRACPGWSRQALTAELRQRHSLADSARQADALPAVQEATHLGLAIPPVAARCPDRGELAAPSPARHGLGVDSKHGRDLGRREEPVVRLDLSSHSCGSSRWLLGDYIVTDSDQCWHYSLESSDHRMSQVPRLCCRSDRQDHKFPRNGSSLF